MWDYKKEKNFNSTPTEYWDKGTNRGRTINWSGHEVQIHILQNWTEHDNWHDAILALWNT